MRERTFTSYINAEVTPETAQRFAQLERMADRTFTAIGDKARRTAREMGGLTAAVGSTDQFSRLEQTATRTFTTIRVRAREAVRDSTNAIAGGGGVAAQFANLERSAKRSFSKIRTDAETAARATAGLVGGGISTGLPRNATAGGTTAAPRIAAANAAITRTSAVTTAQLARQNTEMGRLERHNANLVQGLRSSATALQVVQGPLGPIAGRVTALSNAVERLTGFRLGIAAVGAALFAMTAAANHATQLRQKLAPLYETQELVNQAFERTAGIAKDTRTALEPVVDLYARLTMVGRDVGLNDRQIERTTRAAALGTRISGGDRQSQEAALTQFAQGIGSNRFGGDELRSIMEQAPRIAKAIADGLSGTENFGKVTIGMLRNLGAEGQLTAQRVAGALGRELQTLEKEAERLGPTMASSMNSFTTEFTVTVARLDQSIGLTRTFANVIQFAADNMRELTALVVGLSTAWAGMKIAPALVQRVKDLDAFIAKQNEAFRTGKVAAQAEVRSSAQNLAALTRYNQGLKEKQSRIEAATRAAEQDVTTSRNRADNLAPQARIERAGGFQAGAVREYEKALEDAEKAERRLIGLRQQGNSTTAAVTAAEGQLATATTRAAVAKEKAVVAASRWRTVGMGLLNAINPLGIAVSLLTVAIVELATAESKAERNAKLLQQIQRELADTVDDATGRIREQNEELRRGIGLKSQQAEGLAREQFGTEAGKAAAAALKELQTGTRPMTAAEHQAEFDRVHAGGRPRAIGMMPVYVGGAGGQQATQLLQNVAAGRGGDLAEVSRRLDALAKANPANARLRAAADSLTRELPNLTASFRQVQTEQARQREAAGRGTDNDRRILRGDFSGGRIEGRTPAQLQADAEAERGRLRDPRYRAKTTMDRSLADLEGRAGQLSQKDYIRERADILHTYDQELAQIKRTDDASARRAESEQARQERLAESARDRAQKLENLMVGFEDNAPVKQLEDVYDKAIRAKGALRDLIGEDVAGLGRFSAHDADQRIQQIDRSVAHQGREFLDHTMEGFQDDTPIRRMQELAKKAREAKEAVDRLVGRAVEGYQGAFTQQDAARKKADIDSYVETERRRPFVEQARQYNQQLAVQQLILQGRVDEAAALEKAFGLQEQMHDLSKADLQTLIDQEAGQREVNALVERRTKMVENLVGLADDARQAIEGALGQVAKGRPDRAFTQIFNSLTDSYFKTQIRSVTDQIMAGADQRVRDLVNGRTRVDMAVTGITSGMDSAGSAAMELADRLREAATRVADMPVGPGAMSSPTSPAGVDAVVGAVLRRSETTAGRFLQIAAPLARMVVGGDNFAQHVARGSNGVDLRAAVGTPVHAPFAGSLTWNHTEKGGLQAFVTSLDGRLRAGFAHLSDVTLDQVKQGVKVKLGDVIAMSGNSGGVAAHLHSSLRVDGRAVDPMRYFGNTIDFGASTARSQAAMTGITPGAARTQMVAIGGVIGGLAERAQDFAKGFDWLKDEQDQAAAPADAPARKNFLESMNQLLDSPEMKARRAQETGGRPPSIRQVYNQMGGDIGKNIDKALGSKFAEKVGGKLGDVIVGAGKGQMASGVASMVGIKQSKTGAAVGGAIGQLAAPLLGPLAPFAPFIGGLIGGTLGGLFKKSKSGSSTLSVDQYGNFASAKATGNDAASRQNAFGESSNVGSALKGIADTLFGTVKPGAGTISLGFRASDKKEPYRIDPSGMGRTTGSGVLAFATEQEQISKAIQLMLQKGVIDGISAASENIIQKAGPDLQTAIEKAAAIENIPRQLMQIQDPVRFAVMETNRQFAQLIGYLKEGGATAQQFADASKLYDLTRQQAIDAAKSQATDQIQSFLDDMMGGSNSPLDRATVYKNSRTQIDRFTGDIAGGKVVDQGKLLEAARNFEDASRTLNGSGESFFADFDWLNQLLTKARDNALSGTSSDVLPGSPFASDPQIQAIIDAANGTSTSIDNQTDVLGGLLNDIKGLLGGGGVGGGGGGGGGSSSDGAIGILPGFSTSPFQFRSPISPSM